MSNLINRLRDPLNAEHFLCWEAADEIESLKEENDRLWKQVCRLEVTAMFYPQATKKQSDE